PPCPSLLVLPPRHGLSVSTPPPPPTPTPFPYTTLFRSWRMVQKSGSPLAADERAASTREQLARRIIELARKGEQDPQRQLNDTSDRKSTRLNSSHLVISYAVFCLKKKTSRLHLRLTQTSHFLQHLGRFCGAIVLELEFPLRTGVLVDAALSPGLRPSVAPQPAAAH